MLVIFLRIFFLLNSRMQSSISLLQRQWYWSVLILCYIISNTKNIKCKVTYQACTCHMIGRLSFGVTMQNRWNNRISDGCVYAQIRKGLGMHLVSYSNHDTVPFLLIVPIKGRFV